MIFRNLRHCAVLFCALNHLPAETFQLRDLSVINADSYAVDGNTVFLTSKNDTRIVDRAEIAVWPTAPKPNAARRPTAATAGVNALIDQAAERHGLPPELIHAVAATESRHDQSARSNKGAIGVMQLMPVTARQYGADPHDTAQNIDAGTRFLRELLIKYENHPDQLALALAAYNAGPGAVDFFGGIPPYKETQSYVRKAIHLYKTASKH